MVMFRMPSPRQTIVAPVVTQTLLPTDAGITYSDLAGTWSITAARARGTRPISDGQGFEYATPGARATIEVSSLISSGLVINVQYTGLVTRNDAYNDIGSVEVNNNVAVDFTCPVPHGATHPVSPAQVVVPIPSGTSTVTLVFPYCASMDLVSIGLPAGVTANPAPVRITKRLIGFGDSRVHGFNVTKATQMWLYKACLLKSAQQLNMGYGGRSLNPGDATIAGAMGCDGAIYLAGYNRFYPNNTTIPVVTAEYQGIITNFRAASTAVGKPTAKLVMLSDLWSNADIGEGPYAANNPTLQQFRNAMQAAVTAVADPYCVFLSGNTGSMPTGYVNFPDGVHENDTAATTISTLTAAVLP